MPGNQNSKIMKPFVANECNRVFLPKCHAVSVGITIVMTEPCNTLFYLGMSEPW